MTDVRTLAADPTWVPDALDPGRGLIRFARLDSDSLRREAFLDTRKNAAVSAWAEARIGEIAPIVTNSPPASYIFHSAFCGSTLLARALDAPGRTLSLKEPNILLDLANARRAHPAYQSDAVWRQHCNVILNLLERRRDGAERVVIKPTNLALPLAPIVIERGSPVLFLYGSLKEFLFSILKKGEEGRAFGRKMFNIFAMDKTALGAIDPRQAMSLTDLQVAALGWRHQLEEFDRLLAAPETASLDYASFIAGTGPCLKAAASMLRLDLSDGALAAAASGPVFRTDAKFSGKPFTPQTREDLNAELEARHGGDLALIGTWAEKTKLARDLKLPLQKTLKAN